MILMFHELIDKIVVYEAEGAGKSRTQKVHIYFNYVGQVDIALYGRRTCRNKGTGRTERDGAIGKTA